MHKLSWINRRAAWSAGLLVLMVGTTAARTQESTTAATDPAALVNPLIGTTNGGNDYPGATLPLGMLAWSPEEPRNRPRQQVEGVPGSMRDDPGRPAAPGGYEYTSNRISGFSLTHLMGTGCAGASGDIPFMPYVGEVTSSPADDLRAEIYGSTFSHDDETAQAGYYKVKLENGVTTELTTTLRTGSGRFTYPAGKPAIMLVRTANSETGSTDAHVKIDVANRTVSGSVTSGNFCGYIGTADRRSYYTLYFVAHFDTPILSTGTWQESGVRPNTTEASGGTTYGTKGFVPPGKGSGGWIVFDTSKSATVNARVAISYVSPENAEANLRAENPSGTTFDTVRKKAHAAWNDALNRIQIEGGTTDEQVVFYTALYHTLMGENLYSDVDGRYMGMDGKIHTVSAPQKAQYSTFSGWDVYRSQLQLLTLLQPGIAGDFAQSLLNQANQNGGEWDRWTHNAGITHVMNGDPAAPAIAAILAFGGTNFDARAAYKSLLQAATVPTAHDLSKEGCPVECVGQRPSLDLWLKLHYIPVGAQRLGTRRRHPRRRHRRLRPLRARAPHGRQRQPPPLPRARPVLEEHLQPAGHPRRRIHPEPQRRRNLAQVRPRLHPGLRRGQRRAIPLDDPVQRQRPLRHARRQGEGKPAPQRLLLQRRRQPGRHAVRRPPRRAQQRALHRNPVALRLPRPALEDPGGRTQGPQHHLDQHPQGHARQRRSRRDVLVVCLVRHRHVSPDPGPRGTRPRQPPLHAPSTSAAPQATSSSTPSAPEPMHRTYKASK